MLARIFAGRPTPLSLLAALPPPNILPASSPIARPMAIFIKEASSMAKAIFFNSFKKA